MTMMTTTKMVLKTSVQYRYLMWQIAWEDFITPHYISIKFGLGWQIWNSNEQISVYRILKCYLKYEMFNKRWGHSHFWTHFFFVLKFFILWFEIKQSSLIPSHPLFQSFKFSLCLCLQRKKRTRQHRLLLFSMPFVMLISRHLATFTKHI